MSDTPTCRFRGHTLTIQPSRYANNGNTALVLYAEDGQQFLTATVNLEPLEPHRCYIKDYSENEGVAKALAAHLAPTGESRHTGYVTVKQYVISDELLAILEEVPVPVEEPPAVEDDPVKLEEEDEDELFGSDPDEPPPQSAA